MAASDQFNSELFLMLPAMRKWALALTRNRSAADDLVQDVVVKAIQAHTSFIPGTNFKAWLHRIMSNHFISGMRVKRHFVELGDAPDMPIPCGQEHAITLKRVQADFRQLPVEQREALEWIALEDRSYDDVAGATGVPVGTLKSRVHRARHTLRYQLECQRAR